MRLTLTVNGAQRSADVSPIKRLLDVLREDWGLTGSKEGCGEGECGACTVLIDGRAVNSCLIPACQVDGTDILTVEGLAGEAHLHPLQTCFLTHGGAQCGICTPGFLVMAAEFLASEEPVTEDVVREALAGNLCRCTGYHNIVDSVVRTVMDGDSSC